MMQVSKKIPFEDPNVLMGVRALYIVSNLLIAGIYFYTKMQIDKKRGMLHTIKHPNNPQPTICAPILTSLFLSQT